MLDIKALLTKLINGNGGLNAYDLPNTRFTSLASMGNNIVKILNAIYNINYYYDSTSIITPLQMGIRGEYTIADCTDTVYKFYDWIGGSIAGVYVLYTGCLNTWASSLTDSGTQKRIAATIDLSDVVSDLDDIQDMNKYYAWCLASIYTTNTVPRTIGCSASMDTSYMVVTINALVTIDPFNPDEEIVNLLVYIPCAGNNSDTIIDGTVTHS